MGKIEVVEYSSCFQRPRTNWGRLTAITISTFQWLLTIKCYFCYFSEACMAQGKQNRRTPLLCQGLCPLPGAGFIQLVGGERKVNHLWDVPKNQAGGVYLVNVPIPLASSWMQGCTWLEGGASEESRNVCHSPKSGRDYTVAFTFSANHWLSENLEG